MKEAEKRKILQEEYQISMTRNIDRDLTDLYSLVKTLGFSVEQAMAALKIPEEERLKYLDLMKKQN